MRHRKLCRHASGQYFVTIKRKPIYLGRDKAKAKIEMNRLIRHAAREGAGPQTDLTFAELITDYTAWAADNLAPSTVESRRYFFADLQASKLGNRNALKIRPYDVETYLAAQPRIKSPSTKNTRITVLIGMYNWAVQYGALPLNPLTRMPKPTPRVRQDFLAPGQFAAFLAAIPNDAARDFLTVLLESGARVQEMFKLRAKHFDTDKFVLPIEDSKGKRRSRVIYLPERARVIVARLAAANPKGPLFLNTRGRPWTKDSLKCTMRVIKKTMKLKVLAGTMLRHSYAHYRLTQGQSPVVVSKLLGHTSTAMIEKRYGHLDGSDFLADKANELTMPLGPQPESA